MALLVDGSHPPVRLIGAVQVSKVRKNGAKKRKRKKEKRKKEKEKRKKTKNFLTKPSFVFKKKICVLKKKSSTFSVNKKKEAGSMIFSTIK